MRSRIIHLINPKTDSLTTRPLYFNRALYSPLAGLLAVAACIPRDRYEVILTDENIEAIDFDVAADLVGISAMTAYVNRGYEIADLFRANGVPVVMGGVHPSFMPDEALQHCDAVVIGEAELVMPKLLDDLESGSMRGRYRASALHSMAGLPMPRYDLLKKNRYVNRTFVQTSRGCHQGCVFCAEPLMNGLKFRYRPVDEVIAEMETCGARTISINDADFFGTPERPKEVMRALKGRGLTWQAGVTSKLAQDDRMLELAAESGCTMLSIGFEVHLAGNAQERAQARQPARELRQPRREGARLRHHGVRLVHVRLRRRRAFDVRRHGRFNIETKFDACAYSTLTPYPGTLTWYEMRRADRIVSYDWSKYDQGHVVYRPARMSADELRRGIDWAYGKFYAASSIAGRFPFTGSRSRAIWLLYNLFMRKGSQTESIEAAAPTAEPEFAPMPPILPVKREWRAAVLEAAEKPRAEAAP